MQAQQNQTDQQDAGPAGSRLLALGFRLLAPGFRLLAKRNPPRQPGADIFAPKSYTKVTQKVG